MITVIVRLRVRMRARLKDTRREGSAEIRTFFFFCVPSIWICVPACNELI